MTAGMTTQKLERSRVSLPRAGLGGLLAATLLAGGLIGAVSISQPHGLAPDARDSFRYSRPISGAAPNTHQRGRFDLR